jgi:aspartyl-tRNA(Asn)/glutamyl-tRNA(Gln) amidotransferase subunit A
MELCDLSALEITRMLRSRQTSALEVTEACLARIEEVDGRPGMPDSSPETEEDTRKVHAFISLMPEEARARAWDIDRQFAAGDDPGPLGGIPFTVKDIFCVKDTPSTAASRILANFVSPYTATPVDRMMKAGGISLGKVNLDEFTYGSSNESSAFQPSPRNPWDTSRVPGGSSGGSAASVSAGEAYLSLGTDTAGSIR